MKKRTMSISLKKIQIEIKQYCVVGEPQMISSLHQIATLLLGIVAISQKCTVMFFLLKCLKWKKKRVSGNEAFCLLICSLIPEFFFWEGGGGRRPENYSRPVRFKNGEVNCGLHIGTFTRLPCLTYLHLQNNQRYIVAVKRNQQTKWMYNAIPVQSFKCISMQKGPLLLILTCFYFPHGKLKRVISNGPFQLSNYFHSRVSASSQHLKTPFYKVVSWRHFLWFLKLVLTRLIFYILKQDWQWTLALIQKTSVLSQYTLSVFNNLSDRMTSTFHGQNSQVSAQSKSGFVFNKNWCL